MHGPTALGEPKNNPGRPVLARSGENSPKNSRMSLRTAGWTITLAEIAKKLGKKALEEIANIVKPDTLLA